jgi:hypothetical protein
MPEIHENHPRLCACPDYGPRTCPYHRVDEAEGNALCAAVETYMKQMGLDPNSDENDDIRTGIALLLQPALDAYLDAFMGTDGFTLDDVRAFLEEHPA